jgi:HEAT repeat protein
MRKTIVIISCWAALGGLLLPGCSKSKVVKVPTGRDATRDEIHNASADEWFDRIGEKEVALGYAPNTAGNALIQKAKESAAMENDIVHKASDLVEDRQQSPFRRWQSCYVLSYIGDPRGIPALTRALVDENTTVRGVAACALGAFDEPEARTALETAAKTEKDADVQAWIKKALDGQFLPKK